MLRRAMMLVFAAALIVVLGLAIAHASPVKLSAAPDFAIACEPASSPVKIAAAFKPLLVPVSTLAASATRVDERPTARFDVAPLRPPPPTASDGGFPPLYHRPPPARS